jgi:DNA gyrase subunit B
MLSCCDGLDADDLTSLPQNTTHDWAIAVDASHLERIRRDPAAFAPGGVQHLILEVVAYAAEDLRFFDSPDAQLLPDGHPRRGISVVEALSEWLVLTNHRRDGAWTQRYEHGIHVTGPGSSRTGTTVHFRPDQTARTSSAHPVIDTEQMAASWPELLAEIRHEQD